jgi:iron complex transport system substrate-binding protein
MQRQLNTFLRNPMHSFWSAGRPAAVLIVILLMLVPPACGGRYKRMAQEAPQLAVTVTDGHGYQLQLPRAPQRVVCLGAHVTEMLFAIGADSLVVGADENSDYPELPATLGRVYTHPKLEHDALLGLRPDLVIVADELFPESLRGALATHGIPVYFVATVKLADVWNNLRALGTLTSKSTRANQLADSLQNLAQALGHATAGKVQYPTAILFAHAPMRTIGSGSYLHEMLQLAGGKNVFGNLKEAFPSIKPDSLVARNPEYVLLPEADGQYFANLITESPACNNLTAVLQNQVFQLRPEWYFRPGPRLGLGLVELTRALHPDVDMAQLAKK